MLKRRVRAALCFAPVMAAVGCVSESTIVANISYPNMHQLCVQRREEFLATVSGRPLPRRTVVEEVGGSTALWRCVPGDAQGDLRGQVRTCAADGSGWSEWARGDLPAYGAAASADDENRWDDADSDYTAAWDMSKGRGVQTLGTDYSQRPPTALCALASARAQWEDFGGPLDWSKAVPDLVLACDAHVASSGELSKACSRLFYVTVHLPFPQQRPLLTLACDAGVTAACRVLVRSIEPTTLAAARESLVLSRRVCSSSESGREAACSRLGAAYDSGMVHGVQVLDQPAKSVAFFHYAQGRFRRLGAPDTSTCEGLGSVVSRRFDQFGRKLKLFGDECEVRWRAQERGGDLILEGHLPEASFSGDPQREAGLWYRLCPHGYGPGAKPSSDVDIVSCRNKLDKLRYEGPQLESFLDDRDKRDLAAADQATADRARDREEERAAARQREEADQARAAGQAPAQGAADAVGPQGARQGVQSTAKGAPGAQGQASDARRPKGDGSRTPTRGGAPPPVAPAPSGSATPTSACPAGQVRTCRGCMSPAAAAQIQTCPAM